MERRVRSDELFGICGTNFGAAPTEPSRVRMGAAVKLEPSFAGPQHASTIHFVSGFKTEH